MHRFAHRGLWLVAVMALACQQGDDGDFDFTGPTNTSTPTTLGTGDGSGSSGGAGSGSESTTDPGTTTTAGSESSSDGGDESTTEALPTEPCTTLDVLVVIDNSDTMADEQAKLTAALSPFLALVNEALPDVMGSIHVAVITTDAPEFAVANPTMACTPYASAMNWMAFGPTLSTELACASAAGTMGDPDERPMQMATEALSPELTGLDGFNEGFLRESGPLVVVLLTDEEDDFEELTEWGSPGDPADWVEALAATQGGYVQDVIAISLVGPTEQPNDCPPMQWNGIEGAEPAPRLRAFTESFPHHAVGDICSDDYATFLADAVPEIAAACAAWVPE